MSKENPLKYYEFRMYESAFLWGNFRFFFRSVFLDFIITLFMGLWIREKLKAKSSTALPTELI